MPFTLQSRLQIHWHVPQQLQWLSDIIENIHKAELPKFLFRVVDFMECRTEWVGTATELLTEMKEQEVTPNMVTKYLGQFAYEVLEPLGIEYRTKRTGKSRLIKFLRRDGDDANDAGIAI